MVDLQHATWIMDPVFRIMGKSLSATTPPPHNSSSPLPPSSASNCTATQNSLIWKLPSSKWEPDLCTKVNSKGFGEGNQACIDVHWLLELQDYFACPINHIARESYLGVILCRKHLLFFVRSRPTLELNRKVFHLFSLFFSPATSLWRFGNDNLRA